MDRYSRTYSIALYVLVCLLTIYTLRKGIIPAWQELHSDFPNYYLSSKILLEGKDIYRLYDDEWFNSQLQATELAAQGKFSPFPPATAFVILPIAGFEPLTAKRIWTICNIFFLLLTLYFLHIITSWRYLLCATLILLTGQALINNFRLGQLYLMVGCISVFSYYLVQRGKSGLAGGLLGLVAIIKYFPVVFIAGYALAGNRRLTTCAIGTMLALVFLQISVFGIEVFTTYLTKVLLPHLQGNLSMQSPYAIAFQSWESVLRNVFVFHPIENPSPIINWPAGKWIVQGIMYACITLSAVYVLWQARSLQKSMQVWVYLSLPAITAFVLSPASATYHYLMLVFPFAILLMVLKAGEASPIITGWFILLYVGVGWLNYNYMYKIMEPIGWQIFLFYPRLWVLLLLYLSYIWFIHQKLIKAHTLSARQKVKVG